MSSVLLASPASAPVTKAKSVERHSNHDEALSEDRYGDFVSSINESIFDHKGDKFYLYPRYGKSEHLAKTGLPELDERYTITRYIYATVHGYAPSEWFGFVAVSTPQQSEYLGCREIVVAIRGTISDAEWHQNLFKANMVTCDRIDPSKKARVHCGFYSIYSSTNEAHAFGELSLRNQIFKEVEELVSSGDNKKDVRIVCAGHSLGSSLATLAAADLSINFASGRSNVKVHLVAYASPKVGNAEFKHLVESQSTLVITRYSGVGDLVPHVPIYDAVENWIGVIPNLPITYYQHVGKEQKPDWTKSPYVQPWLLKLNGRTGWRLKTYFGVCHNLQLYLHTIAAQSFVLEPLLKLSAKPLQTPAFKEAMEILNKRYGEEGMEALAPFYKDLAYLEEVATMKEGAPKFKRARLELEPSPFDARDCALLNKRADILKEEFGVPVSWVLPPNKDMKLEDGKWLPRSKRIDDIPDPSNPEYN
ncbi:hypothetical protein SELMODRAFT_424749 [Selaginella moellendorffii]|uniref:Phospholipase A1 n=1 Tax=Selaginella moellendorffii TaxID=88036 RepID=D8SQX8_SELML|nr:hypothetical protein SELMODRAFT_424749 [Selaginella moellendorffii]